MKLASILETHSFAKAKAPYWQTCDINHQAPYFLPLLLTLKNILQKLQGGFISIFDNQFK